MKEGTIESLAGIFVLALAFGFLVFAYNVSNFGGDNKGYKLIANFQNIDGISKGSDVKLAGIKVGFVEDVTLEDDTYYAVLQLKINEDVKIPKDSSAIVSTSGLLGGKYIKLNPGASDDNFENGGKIKFTQSALNIEDLIGKLMYSLTSK
ncbi:MAG: outer membrane lipid asymmetry maintenance protein MlaD [Rickettsiaceae bacterium]